MVVGLLGPQYTHSDLALTNFANKLSQEFERRYFISIRKIFEALDSDEIDLAWAPMENLLHGTVRESFDQLFKGEEKICCLYSYSIHHALSILPDSSKENISIVMSHSQALNQCDKFIEKNFPHAEQVAVSSTSEAFSKVSSKGFNHIAVIGPKEAAENYGFKTLDENIENDQRNTTNFALIAKESPSFISQGPNRSSIAFTFPEDASGTLFSVFKIFADRDINLSKIESRPMPDEPGKYVFFLDYDAQDDEANKKLLITLRDHVNILKQLGTYPVL